MLQKLFELAIQKAMQPECGRHHQFYPYSYLFGHLMRRAEFLIDKAPAVLGMGQSPVGMLDPSLLQYDGSL